MEIKKDSLFYMANAHPEIGRIFSYYDSGKLEAAENAKNRTLEIIDNVLSFEDVSAAGKKEWSSVKEYITDYKNLDTYEKKVLERYAEPFAFKFMNNYSNNS